MAKPNYSFEKRQRENAKKQKKEEKLARKAGSAREQSPGDADHNEPAGQPQATPPDGTGGAT